MNFRKEVKEKIPQRDPFLFVDSFVIINSDNIESSWMVNADNYFFKGHFPSNPIVPGVILIEFIAQTSMCLLESSGEIGYLASVKSAKFRKKVVPGDSLTAKVTKIRSGSRVNSFYGRVFKDETLVAEVEITSVNEVVC